MRGFSTPIGRMHIKSAAAKTITAPAPQDTQLHVVWETKTSRFSTKPGQEPTILGPAFPRFCVPTTAFDNAAFQVIAGRGILSVKNKVNDHLLWEIKRQQGQQNKKAIRNTLSPGNLC